jgi:hypothetical protein
MAQNLEQAVKSGTIQPGAGPGSYGITSTDVTLGGYSFNLYAMFIIGLLGLFFFLMWKAQRNKRLDWVDIITKDGRTVSLTKVLQLIGGIVGTWIVVQMTLVNEMSWEILMVYLAYVASIEGYSKFVQAKYGPIQSQGDGGYGDFRPTRRGGGPTVNVGVQYNNTPQRPGPPKFGGRHGTQPTGGGDPSYSGAAKTPDIE